MKIKNNIAISESGFIFHPGTGESFMVNPSGHEILNLLKEEKSYEEIKDYFLLRYYVSESMLEKDFQDFTGLLETYQMLENEPETKD